MHEVTRQFHKNLFEEKLLQRNQFLLIRNLFEKAAHGILFSDETIKTIYPLYARSLQIPKLSTNLSTMADFDIHVILFFLSKERFDRFTVF